MTVSQDTKATQVGGTHYSATAARCPHCNCEIQHWDLYADAPGLIYSATKHITRHRAKGGKQDLLKAITEIQKIIEQEYPDVQNPGKPTTDEEVMRAEWPDTRGGAAHVEAAHADPWSNMADAHMQDVCQHCGKIREMHFLDDHCYYADDSNKFEKTRELMEVTAHGSVSKEF